MDRETQTFNMFLGKTTDWEYVFLEDAFKYKDWMSWLTYNVFEFHTEREKDRDEDEYFFDNDDCEYLFWEYVKHSHDHDSSYNDWVEMVKDENPNWACYDDSYCSEGRLLDWMGIASEKDWEDYRYSDCRWWWRLWKDSEYSKISNYEYVDHDNFKKFEKLLSKYEK